MATTFRAYQFLIRYDLQKVFDRKGITCFNREFMPAVDFGLEHMRHDYNGWIDYDRQFSSPKLKGPVAGSVDANTLITICRLSQLPSGKFAAEVTTNGTPTKALIAFAFPAAQWADVGSSLPNIAGIDILIEPKDSQHSTSEGHYRLGLISLPAGEFFFDLMKSKHQNASLKCHLVVAPDMSVSVRIDDISQWRKQEAQSEDNQRQVDAYNASRGAVPL